MGAVTTGVSFWHHQFFEPAMSTHCCGGLCLSCHWFTSSLGWVYYHSRQKSYITWLLSELSTVNHITWLGVFHNIFLVMWHVEWHEVIHWKMRDSIKHWCHGNTLETLQKTEDIFGRRCVMLHATQHYFIFPLKSFLIIASHGFTIGTGTERIFPLDTTSVLQRMREDRLEVETSRAGEIVWIIRISKSKFQTTGTCSLIMLMLHVGCRSQRVPKWDKDVRGVSWSRQRRSTVRNAAEVLPAVMSVEP